LDNWFQRKNSSRHLAPSKAWPDSAAIALHAMPLHEFSKAAIEREKARKKFMDELDD
jgi:hypothetical protein